MGLLKCLWREPQQNRIYWSIFVIRYAYVLCPLRTTASCEANIASRNTILPVSFKSAFAKPAEGIENINLPLYTVERNAVVFQAVPFKKKIFKFFSSVSNGQTNASTALNIYTKNDFLWKYNLKDLLGGLNVSSIIPLYLLEYTFVAICVYIYQV